MAEDWSVRQVPIPKNRQVFQQTARGIWFMLLVMEDWKPGLNRPGFSRSAVLACSRRNGSARSRLLAHRITAVQSRALEGSVG
jgi:hypothetical protein